MTIFRKGTLWQSIVRTTEQALRSGSLIPIPTEQAVIEDHGIRFFVRVLAGLRRKDEARREQETAAAKGRKPDPFLPPEKDLTVAEVSGTHLAVLNKYNVVPHHLLIVTREFEDQDMLLTGTDFEALCACMAEYDCLGFYNGGREAGASQEHKHLQVVPLPLASGGPSVPLEPLFARAGQDGITTVPAFSFLHAFSRRNGDSARAAFELYARLLEAVGMNTPDPAKPALQSMPYCLLVSREWMLLAPRSREHFGSISLNSLAFAGSFFVRDASELERLRAFGPMNALRSVSCER